MFRPLNISIRLFLSFSTKEIKQQAPAIKMGKSGYQITVLQLPNHGLLATEHNSDLVVVHSDLVAR